MCDECHQSPHATMCPNNPALAEDHPIMKTCPICEREFDEEDMDYAVCADCFDANSVFGRAYQYGMFRKCNVEVNGFVAFMLSSGVITEVLYQYLLTFWKNFTVMTNEDVRKFISEDLGDFADWLAEQKKGGG